MKNKILLSAVCLAAALSAQTAGAAGVALSVQNPAITPIGGNVAITVLYTSDASSTSQSGSFTFDDVNFNASVAASVGGVCSNGAEDGVGTALIAFSDGEASVMANQTICTFTLTHVGAAAGSFPYTIACAAADIDDNPTTCTPVSGNIVVSSGPPTAPTIAYAPTTLNFPAGTAIGQNQDLNVTLTATGGVNGGATSVACTTSSPGFSIPTAASVCTDTTCATNPLVFRCTSSNATQSGTATCAATPTNPAGAAVNQVITLNCPAANVAPALAYAPAPGPITMPTVGQGQTANSSIAVTPSLGSGTSTSTVSACAFSAIVGATFTAPAGTLTFTGSGTSAQNLNFSCVAPTNGSPDGTATLTCSETIGAGPITPRAWAVTCPDGLPVAAPNVTYTPAAGPITFPAGASVGVSVPGSTTIAVDISGGADNGTGAAEQTTVSCSATAGFTVSGSPIGPVLVGDVTNPNGTVSVSCAAAASAQAGTLTCNAAQSVDGVVTTTPTTFALNCAAAEVNISSAPPAGPISIAGAPLTNIAGSIVLSNSGSDSTLGCIASGAVTLGAVPGTVPSAGSATVPYTCLTGASGTSTNGQIVCTTQDLGAEGTLTYNITCAAVSDVPVPAINNFGKLLMVVLVIGLGLVGLGARRQ